MFILNELKAALTGIKYDMDTLQGINSIPVPARDYHTGDPKQDRIYYVLQRKATEHKKSGRMDLAIACLRKSNELSDYEPVPPLQEKEYMRLVKYLKAAGDEAGANAELEHLRQRHPEFWDRRTANLPRIRAQMAKNRKYGEDLVLITTKSSCPVCSPYNRQVYSISGKSRRYPKLPVEFVRDGGFCPDCSVGITTFFPKHNKA